MKAKKTSTKVEKTPKRVSRPRQLKIVKNDEWLSPYEQAIQGRHDHALYKMNELAGKGTLSDFAEATCILVSTVHPDNGCCVNGRLMLPRFT